MAIERVFLGWETPCLARAADFLCQRWAAGTSVDLDGVLLVTPGARAGRRLLEVLTEKCSGPWVPPRFITPGSLVEHLCQPPHTLATTLQSQLLWLNVLQQAPDLLQTLTPQPPESGDVPGLFALATDLQRMLADLRSHGLLARDVAESGQQLPDFCDEDRWLALDRLHERYQAKLDELNLSDPHESLAKALIAAHITATQTIVLLAVTELPALLKQALRLLSANVLVFVHAPANESAAFDDLGCLIPDAWATRHAPLSPSMLRLADRPQDQANQVLLALAGVDGLDASKNLQELPCLHAPDAVTVGLGDPELAPSIERALSLANIPARTAVGRPLRSTRPLLLLDALARFSSTQRFDDFANLLRHPDISAWLSRTQSDAGVESWLALLDRYAQDHLQGRPTESWLGDPPTAAALKRLWDAVASLLDAAADQPRPFARWASQISQPLVTLYQDQTLTRSNPLDEPLIQSLEAIGQAIRDLSAASSPADPPLTLPQAIDLVVAAVSAKRLTPTGGPPAVELLGWLELHLDDAPALILTGFNEGCVPAAAPPAALLPDRLRRLLGLDDHTRRYARDLYLLTAILHSRPHVTLIAGRRGPQDEPLAPSRLALACDEQELARRVVWFYGVDGQPAAAIPPLSLLDVGARSDLLLPPPQAPPTPLTQLAVTAFRDYLACPYRFFLKHVLGLRQLDDSAVQMQPSLFGTLAHEVLQNFACGGPASSANPDEISAFLSAQLDATFQRRFGACAPVAALLQREQLRQRLSAFAAWQAQHAAEGWRISPQDTERRISAILDVDGQPFTITGRIDRIDQHPDLGYWILDYKTSGDSPEQTHRRGPRHSKEWIDLQLPLYHLLAARIGIPGDPQLGFILLPRDLHKTGPSLANWDQVELASALEKARFVIRQIRAGVYWPPGDPVDPHRDDGLSGVCLDVCLQRQEAIDRLTARLVKTGGPA